MIDRALLILLLLSIGSYTPDEYHLARAIAGEGPDLVSGDPELAMRVGQVVLNRLDARWCPSVFGCVRSGFWGAERVQIPPLWALEAAREVLHRGDTTDDFYVFSLSDCDKLGLTLDSANHWQCNGPWCLAFYGRHTTWD